MGIKERLKKIIALFKELLAVYPWLKLALASIVGLFGGSGVITFLNKYAIYNYAVSYGGRLPVENVPYIDIAISVLTFAFLSISLISALLVYGLLNYIAEVLHRKFKNIPQVILKLVSGLFTSFIGGIITFIFDWTKGGSESLSISWSHLELIVFVVVVGLGLGALIIWKSFIRPFALITSILLVFLVAYKIFDAENYASFLREIQYGGGVPVTLVLKHGEEKGNLFLTTETTSIIWSQKEKSFIETPISNINEIKFHEELPHELPKISGSLARIFRHLWN